MVEGRLREHRYAAGRHYDTLVMGLLRDDFIAREADRPPANAGPVTLRRGAP